MLFNSSLVLQMSQIQFTTSLILVGSSTNTVRQVANEQPFPSWNPEGKAVILYWCTGKKVPGYCPSVRVHGRKLTSFTKLCRSSIMSSAWRTRVTKQTHKVTRSRTTSRAIQKHLLVIWADYTETLRDRNCKGTQYSTPQVCFNGRKLGRLCITVRFLFIRSFSISETFAVLFIDVVDIISQLSIIHMYCVNIALYHTDCENQRAIALLAPPQHFSAMKRKLPWQWGFF